jgi:hypothetical protein
MDAAWTSSTAALQITVEPVGATRPGTSNLLAAPAGAAGATATFLPAAPRDLSGFDELRFWIRADRRADGSARAPFYLEFSFRDAGDAAGEEHRWFVPVNAANVWEQRRIGIGGDRRTAVDRVQITCLDAGSLACWVDELLAVSEQMLLDLETALINVLGASLSVPGADNIALTSAASLGDTTVSVPIAAPFAVGNRIVVRGGSAGDETHDVTQVTPNLGATSNVLQLGDTVKGTLTVGVARASVLVPVFVEAPPAASATMTPRIVVTPLGAVEDRERTPYADQRDSFRPRGSLVACSVRPSARAYAVDYQVAVVAPDRGQQLALVDLIQPRLSSDIPLRVNGAEWPVSVQPSPALTERSFGVIAPITVRVGARLETGARTEVPWVRRVQVGAARPDTPTDSEGIVIQL